MQRLLVLFDLDNTLVDRQGTLTDWAAEFTTRHGLGAEEQAYILSLVADRAYPSTFDTIRARYRLLMSAAELWRTYCTDIASLVSCPADVLGGLDELRAAGWRVGVATNGAVDIQRAKLRATGIAERVDGVFVSEEADARKPQIRHFALAAARCGTELDDGGWMVGDNPVNDIGGGRSAGLSTIWIANDRSWPLDSPGPDHTVPHARAAIDLLLLHSAGNTRTTT
ncbi:MULTISPECIES: HAD-IA family hydrolase [unclassified Streptomyces]|uniref:HAD family hydrolase n=1 Tax=unclassified Streptomyces TaxID=2593676 RepID=UPI0024751D1B|nr:MULTISPECIES: HAD-IA family hydrolase [unclassified Streptomyces]MDH6451715.1 HAD superfamily hydrolase (TIGR01549 family) [Streptomyces sp. SAI-119]MDH6497728.1 HAD superfamily hydrolase (TIGR01549 family) [Streptomyces sp. SAI-149]